jgi:hypothetical protein
MHPLELADSYESLEKVPAEHAALYVEKDGKAVLEISGIKTQADFDRYATALKARLADQAADLAAAQKAGLSRDDVVKLIREVATPPGTPAPGQEPPPGGKVDPANAQRVHDLERELASIKDQLGNEKQQREKAQQTATDTTIKNALTGAAAKAGVRPEAVDSFVELIRGNFEQSAEGFVVTKLEGNTIQGVSPNSKPEEVLTAIKRQPNFSYFWPESKGAGGGPGGAGGGGGGAGADNPWSKAGWNMTAQGQAIRTNRAEAEALAKAAGSFIGAAKPPE